MRLTLATFLENVTGEITTVEEKDFNVGEELIKIIEKNHQKSQ